jgi:hypothetical protein
MKVLKSKAKEEERRSIASGNEEQPKKRRRGGAEGSLLFSCPRLTRMTPLHYYLLLLL